MVLADSLRNLGAQLSESMRKVDPFQEEPYELDLVGIHQIKELIAVSEVCARHSDLRILETRIVSDGGKRRELRFLASVRERCGT